MKRAFLLVVALVLVAGAADAEIRAPVHSFRFVDSESKRTLVLQICPVFVNGAHAEFLDHRVDKDTNILLVRSKPENCLYYSCDMARTWTKIPNPPERVYAHGFVTAERNVLAWDKNEKRLDLLDLRGNVLATQPDAPYRWLGSWGMGQAGKTIIYGEYGTAGPNGLRVWRSEDGG
jgi:hypothetical protein